MPPRASSPRPDTGLGLSLATPRVWMPLLPRPRPLARRRSHSRRTSPTRTRSKRPPTLRRPSWARSTSGLTTRWQRCLRPSGRSRARSSDVRRRSRTSALCGAPRPRSRGCGHATAARSCRWARPSRSAGYRCSRAYCGAKHAIKGFTESVRCELKHEASSVHVTMVQLPALNTPQFDAGRSKMPRRPQPVPPIYEPEVAARAILWAAEHRRRQLYVGGSTVKAIWGNRIAPWFADWYLGRTGFEAQQSEEAALDRPDNLFDPVPGDLGARGRFEDTRERSVQAAVSRHRRALGFVAATVAGAGAAAAAASRR